MQSPDITSLLDAWKAGDRSVEETLVSQLYPHLRARAVSQLRLAGGNGRVTLRPTELVNEAYERLQAQQSVDWRNRSHFLAVAATVMRRVVIDWLRQRGAEKRGGDLEMLGLESASELADPDAGVPIDWLAFEQALQHLAAQDAACARVVELRVFAGLEMQEISELLNTSPSTTGRLWRFARSWLEAKLKSSPGRADG